MALSLPPHILSTCRWKTRQVSHLTSWEWVLVTWLVKNILHHWETYSRMAAFAQNLALNIPNSVLKKWMKTKVWETARDAGHLDENIVRSLLDGYSAAVDWPANYWYRWLLVSCPTRLSYFKIPRTEKYGMHVLGGWVSFYCSYCSLPFHIYSLKGSSLTYIQEPR